MTIIKGEIPWNVRSLIKVTVIVLVMAILLTILLLNQNIDRNSREVNLLDIDSCDFYSLTIKGNDSKNDWDSIRQFLRKKVYVSEIIDRSIFFDQGHSHSPTLYVHVKKNEKGWQSTVVCNDFNLEDSVVHHLLDVSAQVAQMASDKYSFSEIYFYCSILEQ